MLFIANLFWKSLLYRLMKLKLRESIGMLYLESKQWPENIYRNENSVISALIINYKFQVPEVNLASSLLHFQTVLNILEKLPPFRVTYLWTWTHLYLDRCQQHQVKDNHIHQGCSWSEDTDPKNCTKVSTQGNIFPAQKNPGKERWLLYFWGKS